jgi:hypothetical protein
VARLGKGGRRLSFCYEAGPCGYGLHRFLSGCGHDCVVVTLNVTVLASALAGRICLSGLWRRLGLAAERARPSLRVCRLRRQTSVTAGTTIHASKLPLTIWFWGGVFDGDTLQRHLGAAMAESARSWLVSQHCRSSTTAIRVSTWVMPFGKT